MWLKNQKSMFLKTLCEKEEMLVNTIFFLLIKFLRKKKTRYVYTHVDVNMTSEHDRKLFT